MYVPRLLADTIWGASRTEYQPGLTRLCGASYINARLRFLSWFKNAMDGSFAVLTWIGILLSARSSHSAFGTKLFKLKQFKTSLN